MEGEAVRKELIERTRMNTIANVIRKTKATLVSSEAAALSDEFKRRFAMSEGDVICFQRSAMAGGRQIVTSGRIMSVEELYFNQRGGYTSIVKVMPLLRSGRAGNTRSVWLVVNANGGQVKQVGGFVVSKLPAGA